MPCAATQVDLEIVTLNEVSQGERQIAHDITYIWNLKNDTNEFMYKTDSQTQKRTSGSVQVSSVQSLSRVQLFATP